MDLKQLSLVYVINLILGPYLRESLIGGITECGHTKRQLKVKHSMQLGIAFMCQCMTTKIPHAVYGYIIPQPFHSSLFLWVHIYNIMYIHVAKA